MFGGRVILGCVIHNEWYIDVAGPPWVMIVGKMIYFVWSMYVWTDHVVTALHCIFIHHSFINLMLELGFIPKIGGFICKMKLAQCCVDLTNLLVGLDS